MNSMPHRHFPTSIPGLDRCVGRMFTSTHFLSVQIRRKVQGIGPGGAPRQTRAAWGAGPSRKKSSARVNVKETSSGAETGLESVVLTAKHKKTTSASKQVNSGTDKASSNVTSSDGARPSGIRALIATIAPPSLTSLNLPRDPLILASLAVLVASVAIATLAAAAKKTQSDRPVDALARRGFISSDRSVPLQVIGEFEDPTRVRGYEMGSAKLVELEALSPLTAEKVAYHREQRRREHGWMKPQQVLVEGEPIPEGVDPRAVRFIPKKHPFALSREETDEQWSEEVARRRLRQRRGRPEKLQELGRKQLARLRQEMEAQEELLSEGNQGASGNADVQQSARRSGLLPNIDD